MFAVARTLQRTEKNFGERGGKLSHMAKKRLSKGEPLQEHAFWGSSSLRTITRHLASSANQQRTLYEFEPTSTVGL